MQDLIDRFICLVIDWWMGDVDEIDQRSRDPPG